MLKSFFRHLAQRNPDVPKPRILLFGDSHTYAIQRAIERRNAKGIVSPLEAHRLLKTKNNLVMGDTSFEDFLTLTGALRESDVVVSMIGGNQHAVFSTIQHPQRFTFMLPGDVSAEPGAELIPYRALAQHFNSGIRGRDGQSLAALREATRARVVHLQPPPPKRDNDHILKHHESKFAQDNIADLGVSAPELRMAFWRLQSRLLEELCVELNIEVLPPPPAALDRHGYLAPEFYASDATHANPSYGELVLQQIETSFGPAEATR
ncbi:hypothetical protein [Novosphingobium aerophilum]|uniref:SGNH hydrolase-type esterase domain-containing protein n=1 Tax=Novosphingobium aerophilum TaxID=2839843 RepID=A0A7X1F701_9SPHN|nr:hypothetical protein [Novosphingobium aerophilum]MBC2651538.1 hypothetical protein [Novosphingobium aerophilum]